ncbi:phospholipid carrier-dependent glycosyltransferase [Desulfobulbus oligotrophicus]|uniref:Phospholipid carrier-dependent glycosyltransferase n=1 Tax=Desulfobulbus oligotrophicus TaxID=1909699 RepID=A0A7T6AQM4_9BACT|nr:phospholipid carrier-dependent glycosyltransferase [Desulfobulbus oligotrophicus]QQG65901.1 phospholipid carrier-dependent glycosyltransferase [Desulfobulbus oligotrophicus]
MTKQCERALTWGLILLLSALIIATLLLGSVPPVDRDALTHHLFVPKLWLQHGGIYEIPEIPFSYYPMNLDLLYTIPLYFKNDIIPKYIHYSFALLTALLVYQYLNKRLGRLYGLLGALFFLSVPIIVKLSITVYVDLGIVFFTTAALLALLAWAEHGFQPRFLLLAGLCCGLAAGTKYNGLVSVVVLTLLVPLLYQQYASRDKQNSGRALLWAMVFAAVTLTAYSPWLVRNYLWTGNPIYPLHDTFVQKLHTTDKGRQATDQAVLTTTEQTPVQAGNNAFVARKVLYNEPWWQAVLLPVRFFFEGQDDDPRYFDGKLTPFLLILPALAFCCRPANRRLRREQNFLLWFALLYFFFTFFQEAMRIRYVVAIVPPLVILSMYGLQGTLQKLAGWSSNSQARKKISLATVACTCGIMLWYNSQYVIQQFSMVQPLPYVQGKVSRDDYITTFRPEYPVIQWLNARTTARDRLICLFLGNRGYYMDFFPIFHTPYNGPMSLEQTTSPYILVRDDLLHAWLNHPGTEPAVNLPFQPVSPQFAAGGYSVYLRTDQNHQSTTAEQHHPVQQHAQAELLTP